MNSNDDATTRLTNWATLDPTQPYAAHPYEIQTFRNDLLAVLAEHREMRRQIEAMSTEWGVEWGAQRSVYPYDDETAARNAATGSPHHAAVTRLVGSWQPADGGE